MNPSHMKKQLLFALLLLHAGTFLMAQTDIVQWNFNSSFGNIPANGMAPAPSLGSGAINLIGGVTATSANGVTPTDGPTPGNQALNTTTYPAATSNPLTAGIAINTSTAGYNSIHLKYYAQYSGTAARKVVVQIFNGTIWQSVDSSLVTTSGSFITPPFNFDLSAYTAANNNSNLQIRLVTGFSNGNSYQGTTGTYGTGGTIRYDLVTIYGNSTGCGNPATQQATGFRLLKTDNSSAQLTLNRGNGAGCLVLCSASGVPIVPVNATNYAANSTYGSGAALGNAFAVYNTQASNPATHYFNITGLTAGTKYYVAAYEYSSTGYCYLSPALVDSFYCNSTILYPGDVQFVGYDNNIASGRDAYVLTNLKALKTGTSFQIVNSRFEAGAASNVRTNRWYAGGNDPYQELQKITVTYTGPIIPAGSLISFDHIAQSPGNIKINNAITNDLSITDNLTIGNLLSGTAAEQFFITQGRFTTYGTVGLNRYSVLDGHTLHGLSYTSPWVDFSQVCSAGSNASDRQSRLPSDIKCLNLYLSGTSNFGYYQPLQIHSGSQGSLLSLINTVGNWNFGTGTGGNDINASVFSSQFSLTSLPITANWTGAQNGNWFNCTNWENLYVPDSTSDATIPSVTNASLVDVNGLFAAEYSNLATTRNLNITTGSVNISGTTADKLIVYDSLLISSTGSLNTSGTSIDTVIIRGSLQSQNPNGLTLSFNGWLALQGNRQLQPINVSLASTTLPVGVATLSLDNPPGININNSGFESLQKMELLNGILSTAPTAFHYMGAGCSISSPINYFGETNKGWLGSFIDGKVYMRTAASSPYTAPLGSKQKGVFAPLVFQPAQATSSLYVAGYVGTSPPNTSPADINTPPVNHISTQEYWTLTSSDANAAANITLYYTPLSFIGGRGNDTQALQDLQIVQYWDSSAASPRKWRLPTYPISFIRPTSTLYDKISMGAGQYATNLSDPDKNFTFGDGNIFNTLPVQLLSWKAVLQGTRTKLTWQSKDETGIAYYSIEKSSDGKAYHHLQTVYAAGKSYACFDDYPADGWNYYRLKITNIDGKTVYAPIEKVWVKHTPAFSIFPNPATDKVYISLPNATAKGMIILYAPDGKKCLEQSVVNTSFIQLNVKGLTAGWYLVEYSDGKNRLTKKLFIK